MDNSSIVRSLLSSIERRDAAAAKALLTPDFVFDGATPEPISADAWLGMHNALSGAMSDFKFNVADVAEDGGTVTLSVKITGTHDGSLALPLPGFRALAPTGAKVVNAKEQVTATIANGKVSRVHVAHVENGGLPELVRQMGGKLG